MNCNHCSHLRRGEGGVKIGGRASLTTLAPCPCSTYPRLNDEGVHSLTFTVPIWVVPTYAEGFFQYRWCASRFGTMTPRILSVEFLNYDEADFFWQFFLQGYRPSMPDCSLDTYHALTFTAYRSSMGDDFYQSFVAYPFLDNFLLPRWWLYMYAAYDLPYEPIVRISYRFD